MLPTAETTGDTEGTKAKYVQGHQNQGGGVLQDSRLGEDARTIQSQWEETLASTAWIRFGITNS